MLMLYEGGFTRTLRRNDSAIRTGKKNGKKKVVEKRVTQIVTNESEIIAGKYRGFYTGSHTNPDSPSITEICTRIQGLSATTHRGETSFGGSAIDRYQPMRDRRPK